MCTARILLWLAGTTLLISAVSSYETPRPRRNPQNAPPLHLFPGPYPPFNRKPMNSRVIMTHPFKHQFGPIPAHSKPSNNYNKYPPQFRPNGPPKKKPTFYRGPPGPPSFPPNKKYPYYGMPHGIVASFNKPKPNRPPPQQNYRPYFNNDETPKETIATFVNRPVSNPQQSPYNGYTKNPWVSYGPPYPPKPFKSYGVYGNDEEVIQGSQQVSATIKYPGHQKPRRPIGQKRPIKFNSPSGPDYPSGPEELSYNPSAPGLHNPSAQGSNNPSVQGFNNPSAQGFNNPSGQGFNSPSGQGLTPSGQGYSPQGSSHVNFDPTSQGDDHQSAQVSASVRYPGYPGAVNTPTLNYPEAVGTQVNYPAPSSSSGKRRRPQRQEESAVQITPSTVKPYTPGQVFLPTPNSQPREVPNLDDFLQETFAPDLSGQPSQPQPDVRSKGEAKRQKARHRPQPPRQYEVQDQAEEREGEYEGWQPSDKTN